MGLKSPPRVVGKETMDPLGMFSFAKNEGMSAKIYLFDLTLMLSRRWRTACFCQELLI